MEGSLQISIIPKSISLCPSLLKARQASPFSPSVLCPPPPARECLAFSGGGATKGKTGGQLSRAACRGQSGVVGTMERGILKEAQIPCL